jgi:hypothetical protein
VACATTVATITTITTFATATATVVAFASSAGTHDRRRAFFQRINANGQEAHDVFGQTHTALNLINASRAASDVQHDVVCFAVLVHAVSQVTQTPELGLGHFTIVFADNFGILLCQSFNLSLAQVRACQKHAFI